MTSPQEEKLKRGAVPFLEPGEEVLAGFIAAPRGFTRSVVISPSAGAGRQGQAAQAAEQAGVRLGAPMGLALTQRRLLLLRIGTPIGLGIGGKVKELFSAVPLAEVDSIEVKRIAMRLNIVLTIRSVPIELEAGGTASAKDFAEAFDRVKAAQG